MLVGALDQLRPLQPVARQFYRLFRGFLVSAESQQAEHREAGSAHELVVLRDQQVLQHRHAGKQAYVLEGAGHLGVGGDPEIRHALEQVIAPVLPVDRDHAHGRLVKAGQAIEDGGLASAVRADQRGDLAAPGGEAQIVDGDKAPEAHRKMLDVQDLVGMRGIHQPCPSLVKLPDTFLRSNRKAVGERLPTKPRGFQIITITMARPKRSMR